MHITDGGPLAAMARLYRRAYVLDREWLLEPKLGSEPEYPARMERETWPSWQRFNAARITQEEALKSYNEFPPDKVGRKRCWEVYLMACTETRHAEAAYRQAVREWRDQRVRLQDAAEGEAVRTQMDEGRLTLCPFFWSCVYAFFGYQCLYVPYRRVRNWLLQWMEAHPLATKRIGWSVLDMALTALLFLLLQVFFPGPLEQLAQSLGLVEPPVVEIQPPPTAEELARQAEQRAAWQAEEAERQRLAAIEQAKLDAAAKAGQVERQARWEVEAPQRAAWAKAQAEAAAREADRRQAGYWEHIWRRTLHIAGQAHYYLAWMIGIVGGFVLVVIGLTYLWQMVEVAYTSAFPMLGLSLYALFLRYPKLESALSAVINGFNAFESWVGRKMWALWSPVRSLGVMVGQFLYWRFYRKACPFLKFDEELVK